jgi:glycosyltransferase involved in cell wall biosynthesis
MLLFSIIVPIYKVENYLRQCLGSVLVQTFTDYECILVDDGSPDNCPAICDEYAVKDTRFSVIHKENGGLSDARNVGIQAAIGEYIVLLDSDDLFAANDALENLYNVIQETKAPVIFNSNLTTVIQENYSSYDGFEKGMNCLSSTAFHKIVMRNQKILLAGWEFTLHRALLFRYGLFFKKGILHEDEHWMPRVLCTTEKIGINHSLFYKYRRGRDTSIMGTINPSHSLDKLLIIDDLLILSANAQLKEHSLLFRQYAARLCFRIFTEIDMLYQYYPTEYTQVVIKLKKMKKLLLETRNIKYTILYIFIFFTGIKNVRVYINIFYNIKNYLCNKSITK